jgi:hypothetical protein
MLGDVNLGRTVQLKILTSVFASGPDPYIDLNIVSVFCLNGNPDQSEANPHEIGS